MSASSTPRALTGERQREVGRDRGLADASLARGHRDHVADAGQRLGAAIAHEGGDPGPQGEPDGPLESLPAQVLEQRPFELRLVPPHGKAQRDLHRQAATVQGHRPDRTGRSEAHAGQGLDKALEGGAQVCRGQ
jgi:hypothetical protein